VCKLEIDIPVYKGTKCSKPRKARDEVNWVVHEAGGEGKEPYQAEDEGPGGDDLSVDLPSQRAYLITMMDVEKVAHDSKNDL
jgi:hypothetical protein